MRCPNLSLKVGTSVSRAVQRTRSALTGNPLSGAVARIPIEDSLSLARLEFTNVFHMNDAYMLDAMSWSDNLSCIASSISDAIHNFRVWEHILLTIFNMHIKPSSRVVVPSRSKAQGDSVVSVNGEVWRVVDRELVLGSWLTGTGEDVSERLSLQKSWNSVFWKHSKVLLNQKATPISRLRFWKRLSFSLADYRLPGMRPNAANGQILGSNFNVYVRRICGFRALPTELVAIFCARRNLLASGLKREVGAEV